MNRVKGELRMIRKSNDRRNLVTNMTCYVLVWDEELRPVNRILFTPNKGEILGV